MRTHWQVYQRWMLPMSIGCKAGFGCLPCHSCLPLGHLDWYLSGLRLEWNVLGAEASTLCTSVALSMTYFVYALKSRCCVCKSDCALLWRRRQAVCLPWFCMFEPLLARTEGGTNSFHCQFALFAFSGMACSIYWKEVHLNSLARHSFNLFTLTWSYTAG